MKIFNQLFWILLFSLFGEIISIVLSPYLSIPASVIGMVLLFIALHNKWIKISQIEEVGSWLSDNMGIFFVPAGVGILANLSALSDNWWQLLIVLSITTILMLAFVAKIVQIMMDKYIRSEGEKK